jgi:hypothetical protein
MSMQTNFEPLPVLLPMLTSCSSNQKVEYLGFEGCPNTPELRARLVEANPSLKIVDVDLMSLHKEDPRLGWGAPTILIEGEDLFGMPASKDGNVSCRRWSDGLPTSYEIQHALEARSNE